MPSEQIALYVGGFAIFVALATYASFVSNLLRLRIQRLRYQLRDASTLPDYLRELYAPAVRELEAAGFTCSHCLFSAEFLIHERSERCALVLINERERIYAEIAPANHFAEMPGFEVTFTSFLRDGSALQTVNGRAHCFSGALPGVTLNDPYAASLSEQLDSHRHQLRELSLDVPAIVVTPKVFCALLQRIIDAHIGQLIRDKAVRSTGGNAFRLRPQRAAALALRFFRGERKRVRAAQRRLAASADHAAATRAVPVAAEVDSYLRFEAMQKRQPHGFLTKLLLFAVTFVMAYFAFGVMFSFENVLIFLGVLLFHELGHLAAMRIFKYRDLQVLFIPFLGAAAVGNNENASSVKQVVVYLMGPLPGILLGAALLLVNAIEPRDWLFDTAIIMLVLNYLNMLPFEPLDGGHIFRIALLDRFPSARLIFSMISVAAFALSAYILGEPVLWILAFLMLAALPTQWQQARVFKDLMRDDSQLQKSPRPKLLTRVFQILRADSYRQLSFAYKFRLVKAWEHHLLNPPPAMAASVALFAVYAAIVAGPPAALVGALRSGAPPDLIAAFSSPAAAPTDWRSALANAHSEQQRWQVSLNAISDNATLGKFEDAAFFVNAADSIASNFDAQDIRHASLWEEQARLHAAKDSWKEAAEYIRRAADLRFDQPDDDVMLAHDIELLSYYGKKLGNDLVEPAYRAALARTGAHADRENWQAQYRLLDGLARHYYEAQRWSDAATITQQRLELFEQFNPRAPLQVAKVESDLGWYFYRGGAWLDSEAHLIRAVVLMRDAEKLGADKVQIATAKVGYHLDLSALYIAMKRPTQALVEISKADALLREMEYESVDDYLHRAVPEFDYEKSHFGDRSVERAHAHAATLQAVRQLVADLE